MLPAIATASCANLGNFFADLLQVFGERYLADDLCNLRIVLIK